MAGKFSVEGIFKVTDRFTRPLDKIHARISKFTRAAGSSLKTLDRAFGSVHRGLVRMGTIALAAGGVFGLAAKNVIGAGADFEQAITAVGAVSLLTRDQIGDLEKKALELGATTKFTATEAANGMELMAKAGFTNAEILQGIGGILNAAAAEGAELAETASHVSNVLKGMGLATSEATRVADVLTLASARTNSSISSLGESMANVSSTARDFGIPLEEAVGAVALLQDVGLDASVAGSAVNTMLTKMAAPTAAMKKQMKEMAVSFEDANGNMLPLSEVLGQLDKAAKKSGGNMDQVAFFAELVGLRGQKAASNLAKLFESGKFATLTDELNAAKDSAEKMAKLRMDNLKGDMTLLASAIDGVKVALFNTQSGPLRGVVQGMTKWLEANQALIKSKVNLYISEFRVHLPEIVKWTKRIAIGIGIFYALSAAIKVARVALALYEGVVIAVTVAKKAYALAAGGVVLVQKAIALSSGLAAAGLTFTAAAAVAAIGPWLALGAAIAAVALAWQQNEALRKETEGLGIGDLVWGSLTEGKGFFEQVDEHQNKLAKQRAHNAATAAQAGPQSAPMGALALDQIPALAGMGIDNIEALGAKGMTGVGDTTAAALSSIETMTAAGLARMASGGEPPIDLAGERHKETVSRSESTSRVDLNVNAPKGTTVKAPKKIPGVGLHLQQHGTF